MQDSPDKLALAFYKLPIAPYAPVRRQLLLMLREVNRIRKLAGRKQLPPGSPATTPQSGQTVRPT